MTPNEALEWAADYAERYKIFDAPKNDRGYVKDNWKEPTAAERVAVIKDLAATVVEHPVTPVTAALSSVVGVLRNAVQELDNAEGVDPVGYNYTKILRLHRNLKEVLEEIDSA